MRTTLVCVVSGGAYQNFADDLFASAEEFFHPTNDVDLLMLAGRDGWPDATLYRYHALAEQMPDSDYVFLSDADMLFESPVWQEVLPDLGIAATLHPGYVTMPPELHPYERRSESAACVYVGGMHYFCGGFIGGTREAMLYLAQRIVAMVDTDTCNNLTPIWHDESCLNRCLLNTPPRVILPPSYCYPDNDAFYRTIWAQEYERKLVALDKTEEERGER